MTTDVGSIHARDVWTSDHHMPPCKQCERGHCTTAGAHIPSRSVRTKQHLASTGTQTARRTLWLAPFVTGIIQKPLARRRNHTTANFDSKRRLPATETSSDDVVIRCLFAVAAAERHVWRSSLRPAHHHWSISWPGGVRCTSVLLVDSGPQQFAA